MPGLREALEEAYDTHTEPGADDGESSSSSDAGGERAAPESGGTGDVQESSKTPGNVADKGTEGDDANVVLDVKPAKTGRDAAGKFVPAAKPDANALPADGQKALAADRQQAAAPARGPVSWRPDLREKFAKLDPDVQQEVLRRDKEVETALRETSGARQYAAALHQVISPYEAMIRAEGGNAVTAVDSLLKTAYHLRTANPHQKATMVAQMITQHAVDLDLLDNVLSQLVQGKQAQIQQDPMMQHVMRELAPIKQFVSGLQQRQGQMFQADSAAVQTEYEAFAADPANEFINDVASDMADFLDVATKQGRKMSLSEAYTRATLAHPTISKVIADRKVSAGAAQRSAATRRARNASASLPSGGAPAGAADNARPKGIRSAVEAAWDQVAERDS